MLQQTASIISKTSHTTFDLMHNNECIYFLLLPLAFTKFEYRHSSIYAVNVGTQKKNHMIKNRVNRGYLVVLKGRNI